MKYASIVSIVVLLAAGCSSDETPPADTAGEPTVASTAATTTTTATTVAETTTVSTAIPTSSPPGASSTTDRPVVINEPATVDMDTGGDDADAAAPDCSGVPRGVAEFVLESGGARYDVRVYVPETLLAEPAPVVLDFHGLGGNGPQQAAYSGYETVAEQEGFIAVHPTGVGNSWELAEFDLPDRDDLVFVDVLIDAMVADWCGDGDRVYSTGFSNGGFFTASLLCERADRIAAAASIAGLGHPDGCAPSRPVPYVAFHGTDDVVVPFDGDGDSPLAVLGEDYETFFSRVMPDEFAEFAASAGCSPQPERTEVTEQVVRYDYAGCDDDIPMTFFELPGSGHTWPNSPRAGQSDALGVHATDVDATVDAWEFFRQFSL